MRNLWMALLWAVLLTGSSGARAAPPQTQARGPLRGVLANGSHTVALDADGTVWSWGYNASGQLGNGTTRDRPLPAALETIDRVKFIDAGASHTVALREDGTVWAWGLNRMGQLGQPASVSEPTPQQVPGLTDGVAVEAGSNHSLMLREDGTVWSWGSNTTGQLGRTTPTSFDATPVRVPGLTDVVALSAGNDNSLALREDGTVWSWGNNANGQLGRATSTRFDPLPARVPGLTGVVALSAGSGHVLALREDGSVWAWGNNQYLQLGFPNATSSNPTPRQVPALTDAVDVAAGSNFSLVRRADGSVWTWGLDPSVQSPWEGNDIPQRVEGPRHVIALAAGALPLVLDKDGTVWGWGWNTTGALGTGSNLRSTPVRTRDLSKIVSLSAGAYFSLALREDGTVWGWGDNRFAQLSPWLPELRATPSQVMELPKAVAIATGVIHSLAVAEDGTVWGWGDNNDGQFGPQLPTASPVQVEGLSGMVAVTAGPTFSLALRADGTVWGLGRNSSGQLGFPGDFDIHTTPRQVPELTGVVALSAGNAHVLALREDGTVWTWGANLSGQLGVELSVRSRHTPAPVPGLTDVVAISSGREFSLALRSDGTVWAWGYNKTGELGDGTLTSRYTPAPVPGLTDVVGLMGTSYGTALVLRRDGSIWGFGLNTLGMLANTAQLFYSTPVQLPAIAGVKALSAGEQTGFALLEDGTVRAWGSNRYDQIGDGVSSAHRTAVQARLPCRFTAMTSRDHRASEVKHCPAGP
ncbi:alpha-tubulin suppressor-like RCC1 family protein [Archangium gephyra]|uniref:Alpha-tubulin suppressor-like RCC1 family protein n=2 Tax=Archangium gephyra TaxID=48 RepID=A0ABX9K6X3_9BACT|nr:alpha-tubulin suppressor-like RCC1 family protein [Archangium gephyra]